MDRRRHAGWRWSRRPPRIGDDTYHITARNLSHDVLPRVSERDQDCVAIAIFVPDLGYRR
jgi:hypothetical protein